tara:strand:+ start:580 stop:711 length:132 start_codon:yes stop_codon:yes gene_type:complete
LKEQEKKIVQLKKHIAYIQKVLKEKQDELFCLKVEYKQLKDET